VVNEYQRFVYNLSWRTFFTSRHVKLYLGARFNAPPSDMIFTAAGRVTLSQLTIGSPKSESKGGVVAFPAVMMSSSTSRMACKWAV